MPKGVESRVRRPLRRMDLPSRNGRGIGHSPYHGWVIRPSFVGGGPMWQLKSIMLAAHVVNVATSFQLVGYCACDESQSYCNAC